jgi:hypothetical protein
MARQVDITVATPRIDRMMDCLQVDGLVLEVREIEVDYEGWSATLKLVEGLDVEAMLEAWECAISHLLPTHNLEWYIDRAALHAKCSCATCYDEAEALADAIDADLAALGTVTDEATVLTWLYDHIDRYTALLTALYDCARLSCDLYGR